MWYNHVPSDDGRWVESLDRRSYYGLCDVTKGERWLAAQWINIIGDGNSRFKAWRSGRSWVGQKRRAAYPNIYDRMARRKDSEVPDIIEEEISRDMEERSEPSPAGPPERHVLGAVSMLLNALDDEGLRAVSMHVHQKLQLMCVPLVFNRGGKVSVVDGSKEWALLADTSVAKCFPIKQSGWGRPISPRVAKVTKFGELCTFYDLQKDTLIRTVQCHEFEHTAPTTRAFGP